MSEYCKKYNRVAWSSPNEQNVRLFTRLRCKRWQCEYCAEVNRRMWRAHILDNLNALTDEDMSWSFVTITSPACVRGAHDSYRAVNSAWRKITELWRDYHRWYCDKNIEYVRVLEPHADGAIHAHSIVGHYARLSDYNLRDDDYFARKKKWSMSRRTMRFSDLCARAGAGYIADIQAIDGHAGLVTAYITKYITKDVQSSLDLPTRARRMLTSRGFTWSSLGEDEALTWHTAPSLDWQTYLDISRGAKFIKDLQTGDTVKIDTFERGLNYPPTSDRD